VSLDQASLGVPPTSSITSSSQMNDDPNRRATPNRRNKRKKGARKGAHLASSGMASSSFSSSSTSQMSITFGDSSGTMDSIDTVGGDSLSAQYALAVDDTCHSSLSSKRPADVQSDTLAKSFTSDDAEEALTSSRDSSSPFFHDSVFKDAGTSPYASSSPKNRVQGAAPLIEAVETSGEEGWEVDDEADFEPSEVHPLMSSCHRSSRIVHPIGYGGSLQEPGKDKALCQKVIPPIERWTKSHGFASKHARDYHGSSSGGVFGASGLPVIEPPHFDVQLESRLSQLDPRSPFSAQHVYMAPGSSVVVSTPNSDANGGVFSDAKASCDTMTPRTHLLPPNDMRGWRNDEGEEEEEKRRVPHGVHAMLCALCCGLWLPCWIGACTGVCCEQPFQTASKMCDCCSPSSEQSFGDLIVSSSSSLPLRKGKRRAQFETVV